MRVHDDTAPQVSMDWTVKDSFRPKQQQQEQKQTAETTNRLKL